VARVWSAIYGCGFNLENFPYKRQYLLPFGSKKSLRVGSKSTQVKGGLASYLLRVKSKLGSGQGPSLTFNSTFCVHQLSSGHIFIGCTTGFFCRDCVLFDGFLPTLGKRLVPGFEPLTVQSLN